MEPQLVQQIVEDVTNQINRVKELVHQPIILTSPIVRIYFKRLIDQFMPNITVLSFNEIDTNIQIQAIGLIQGNHAAT
jgi:flagellar biosynthesis protein FlhA